MKHTIEIEGLPEGYNIKCIKLTEKVPFVDGTISALVHVKKKQPRRIVLEETKELKKAEIILKNRWWRIVEDSGENDD